MQKKVLKNAGWIVGCKVVKAIVMLIVTAITARYLGKEKYGIITYASGLCAFVIPIMQLGLNSTFVHEITNRPGEDGKVVGTIIGMSMVSAIFCVLGIVSFSMIATAGQQETILVCSIYSVMLFFHAMEMIQYWFQAKLMAKFSAFAMMIAYVFVSIFQILLVVFKAGVYFFAISYSLDFFLIAIILIVVFKKKSGQKLTFSFSLAKELLSVSKFYIIANLMSTVYVHTDVVMLNFMAGSAETGIYGAAWNCANMFNFVFAAIIDSMRPTIYEGKNINQQTFEKRTIELFSILFYFAFAMIVMMMLFSPLVIKIMYGEDYVQAVDVLRIVVWMTVFSYVGTARSAWMLAENKHKYLWIINLVGVILNVIVNYLLIPIMGAIGAAIASVATQFISNVLINFIMRPMIPCGVLMLKSLNPKHLKNIFTSLKKDKGEEINEK